MTTNRHFYCLLILACAHAENNPQLVMLSNGLQIPLLGFGTASLENDYEAMTWAIQHGYTLIDTASLSHPAYHNVHGRGNAEDLGALLKEQGLRSRIQVISKNNIWNHGYNSTLKDVNESLAALMTDFIDVFLIHHPSCISGSCEGSWKDTWLAMESLYKQGVLKSIGVSNFNVPLLKELLSFATVKPHIVQNRHDPLQPDWPVVKLCKEEHMFFQAFSTLGRQYIAKELKTNPDTISPVLSHSDLRSIAQRHQKDEAQIALRWAVQRGIGVLPKSAREHRIRSNSKIFDFELSLDEIATLDGMHGGKTKANPNEMQIQFVNTLDVKTKIFWKGPQGLALVLELNPKDAQGMNTHVGHTFVVKVGSSEEVFSTHIVQRDVESFRIGSREEF